MHTTKQLFKPPSARFLTSCEWIDWQHPLIQKTAQRLTNGKQDPARKVAACFHFVRDEIAHSGDLGSGPVTCRASAVLQHRTGYCYAKSHLLAALLRANGFYAGLCYQRLSIDGNGAPWCLHGLNAVWLQNFGWYRLDARGNKPGVHAEFSPPHEQLAFSIQTPDECDLPEIWATPRPEVVEILTHAQTVKEVRDNLPDVECLTYKLNAYCFQKESS